MRAFLIKPVDRTLIDAVQTSFEKTQAARTICAEMAEIRARLATLTPRQLEVLCYVVAGKRNKVIAAESDTVEITN